MAYLVSEIFQDHVIDKLDVNLEVVAVEAAGGDPLQQRVKFCKNKWIKLYDKINFNGNELTVDSYDEDGFITFNLTDPADEMTKLSVPTLNRPLLFNGTLSNTKLEWHKYSEDEREKLPFLWMVSPTQEVTKVKRDASLKIWFVHWADWNKLNADRQAEAVKPLFELIEEVINTIERNSHVFEGYDNYTTRDFPKFGVEGPNGVSKTIFNTTLAAIEMDIVLRIFARYCINC